MNLRKIRAFKVEIDTINKLIFSPHHFVDNSGIALDDYHHFGGYILFYIIRHRNTIIAVFVHFNSSLNSLEQRFLINACDEETCFVQRFWTLRGSADADGWEGMPDTGEETTLLRESATVADHGKSVHLEAIVVVKS